MLHVIVFCLSFSSTYLYCHYQIKRQAIKQNLKPVFKKTKQKQTNRKHYNNITLYFYSTFLNTQRHLTRTTTKQNIENNKKIKWVNLTCTAKVPRTIEQKMGLANIPSKTFLSPWILRALISLKSCMRTKVLNMMV